MPQTDVTLDQVAGLYRRNTNHLFLAIDLGQLDYLTAKLSNRDVVIHRVENLMDYLDVAGVAKPVLSPPSAYLAQLPNEDLFARLGFPLDKVLSQFDTVDEIFPAGDHDSVRVTRVKQDGRIVAQPIAYHH